MSKEHGSPPLPHPLDLIFGLTESLSEGQTNENFLIPVDISCLEGGGIKIINAILGVQFIYQIQDTFSVNKRFSTAVLNV